MLTAEQRETAIRPTGITPRKNQVIVRILIKDEYRGIKLPQNSPEGKLYVVVAIGPEVKNLNVGDEVLITARVGQEWQLIPGEPELVFNIEEHVPLIITPVSTVTIGIPEAQQDVNTPVFNADMFPDANLASAAHFEITPPTPLFTPPPVPSNTITLTINSEPLSIPVKPGMEEEELMSEVKIACLQKYGSGELHATGNGNYHWRTNSK